MVLEHDQACWLKPYQREGQAKCGQEGAGQGEGKGKADRGYRGAGQGEGLSCRCKGQGSRKGRGRGKAAGRVGGLGEEGQGPWGERTHGRAATSGQAARG